MPAKAERDRLHDVQIGPRAKMAARLFASGAVRSKHEACKAMGLTPNYLAHLLSGGNPEVQAIMDETDRAIADQAVSLSKVVALLSRPALRRVKDLIQSDNEYIAMRAASDVLDRNPETSKTFKSVSTSFSLDPDSAKELAKSLIEAARVKEQYAHIAAGDFVRVDMEADSGESEAKPKGLPGGDARGEDPGDEGAHPSVKDNGRRDVVQAVAVSAEGRPHDGEADNGARSGQASAKGPSGIVTPRIERQY